MRFKIMYEQQVSLQLLNDRPFELQYYYCSVFPGICQAVVVVFSVAVL
jgi:hypothetical protein